MFVNYLDVLVNLEEVNDVTLTNDDKVRFDFVNGNSLTAEYVETAWEQLKADICPGKVFSKEDNKKMAGAVAEMLSDVEKALKMACEAVANETQKK